jgi:hypothetical protein
MSFELIVALIEVGAGTAPPLLVKAQQTSESSLLLDKPPLLMLVF